MNIEQILQEESDIQRKEKELKKWSDELKKERRKIAASIGARLSDDLTLGALETRNPKPKRRKAMRPMEFWLLLLMASISMTTSVGAVVLMLTESLPSPEIPNWLLIAVIVGAGLGVAILVMFAVISCAAFYLAVKNNTPGMEMIEYAPPFRKGPSFPNWDDEPDVPVQNVPLGSENVADMELARHLKLMREGKLKPQDDEFIQDDTPPFSDMF